MKDPQSKFVTKDDLKKLEVNLVQKIKDEIETFAGQIISAVGKMFEEVATKSELSGVKSELKSELSEVKSELSEVKSDVKEVKRRMTDLEADVPTAKEVKNHEKRILKLEEAVFVSP